MDTEDKKNRNESKDQNTQLPKPGSQQPQKQWDERPGERDSNPKEQQRQREWEEAEKKQEENAIRPGIDKGDMKQHDNQGNPTDRDEDFRAEE